MKYLEIIKNTQQIGKTDAVGFNTSIKDDDIRNKPHSLYGGFKSTRQWESSRIGFNELSGICIRSTSDHWTHDFPVEHPPARPVSLFANNGSRCTRVSCRLCHVLERVECIQTISDIPVRRGYRPREMRFRSNISISVRTCRKVYTNINATRRRRRRKSTCQYRNYNVKSNAACLAFSRAIIDYPGLCNKNAEKCALWETADGKSSALREGTEVCWNCIQCVERIAGVIPS